MFQIDALSRRPIYEQLISQVERFILTGVIRTGEQIPSVRTLSVELAINPNTIQKAYSELDRRGLTYSVPGKGCFVSVDAVKRIGDYRRSHLKDFIHLVGELAMAGISKEEVIRCVEAAYHGEEGYHD